MNAGVQDLCFADQIQPMKHAVQINEYVCRSYRVNVELQTLRRVRNAHTVSARMDLDHELWKQMICSEAWSLVLAGGL